VTLIRADARALPLADASVDLVVTSPPYWALRSYTDGGEHYAGQIGSEPTPASYIASLIDVTRECMRVLTPAGSIWVNLGDKYASDSRGPNGSSSTLTNGAQQRPGLARASAAGVPRKSLIGLPWRYALRCIDELGLILRAEVIWSKPNGLPESVGDRVRRSHETWFHLVRQGQYFSAVEAIRTPAVRDDARASGKRYSGHIPGIGRKHQGLAAQPNHPLGSLPGSVWEIATEPLTVPAHLGVDHFAAFPTEWPRRIIRGWSPTDGTVLDPFGGTGTTALVAEALGRRGVSVDMSADYLRIAAWRTADPGQRAKALGVPKPPVETAGQLDLLGDPSPVRGTVS
jgi:DNA modification methylase